MLTRLLPAYKPKNELSRIFNGCDRLRIFRKGNPDENDVINEFNILLTGFNIPFFCYDFQQRQGILTLDNFMGERNEHNS